jgi:hypothetical protein
MITAVTSTLRCKETIILKAFAPLAAQPVQLTLSANNIFRLTRTNETAYEENPL